MRRARIESIDIETVRDWADKPFLFGPAPDQTLLLGMTDNFKAQAHVNRLALLLGIPSLCAQIYAEGRAAELTFTVPGITPACHRCILAPRYAKYESGFTNIVGTAGAPVFATMRLNAIKGFLALAILHHGTSHPRWGRLLAQIGERNLVQIRMDPALSKTLCLSVFDRAFAGANDERVLFDEAVWLPQAPQPDCPDCGGSGVLPAQSALSERTSMLHGAWSRVATASGALRRVLRDRHGSDHLPPLPVGTAATDDSPPPLRCAGGPHLSGTQHPDRRPWG